jgi:hypothetical protein
MPSLPRERIQRTKNRGSGHPTSTPVQRTGKPSSRMASGHLNHDASPVFSFIYPASQRLRFGGVESSMGCKQYARMLGLSRGYPHILYRRLNKWDAAPLQAYGTTRGRTFPETHPDRYFCARVHFGVHGYIDIFKNFTRRDSLRAVGGLNQVVASLAVMFASEHIPEL